MIQVSEIVPILLKKKVLLKKAPLTKVEDIPMSFFLDQNQTWQITLAENS